MTPRPKPVTELFATWDEQAAAVVAAVPVSQRALFLAFCTANLDLYETAPLAAVSIFKNQVAYGRDHRVRGSNWIYRDAAGQFHCGVDDAAPSVQTERTIRPEVFEGGRRGNKTARFRESVAMSMRRVAWIIWSTWLVCMSGVFAGMVYTASTSDGLWRLFFITGAAVVAVEIRNFLRLTKPWQVS